MLITTETKQLGSCGTILVIPPDASPDQCEWWPKDLDDIKRPESLPVLIRISSAVTIVDPLGDARWETLPTTSFFSELGVNDFRYSL